MLADDLFAGIALEALSARVPADYDSLRRQHVDGEVTHVCHQQRKLVVGDGVRRVAMAV
jgi:hypothetical protein